MLDVDKVKESIEFEVTYRNELTATYNRFMRDMKHLIAGTDPSITLTREDQHVCNQIIQSGTVPTTVGNYIDLTIEDPELSHWTQQDREACMAKLQNLGLIAIKTAENKGSWT